MNISFTRLISSIMEMINEKRNKLLGYGALTPIVFSLLFGLSLVVVIIIIGLLLMTGSVILSIVAITGLLAYIALICFFGDVLPICLAMTLTNEEKKFGQNLKKLTSLSNFGNYVLRVGLPLVLPVVVASLGLIFILLYLFFSLSSGQINLLMIRLTIILIFIIFFIYLIFIKSKVILPMLLTGNYKEGRQQLGQDYSGKDLFLGFAKLQLLLVPIIIISFAIRSIPLVGNIASMVLMFIATTTVYSGYILAINNKNNETSNIDNDKINEEIGSSNDDEQNVFKAEES